MGAAIEKTTTLSARSGDSLHKILEYVEHVNDQIQAIATASEQQSATSEEINRSVEQVATISAETAQAMDHASKAVDALSQQTAALQGLIREMKTHGWCPFVPAAHGRLRAAFLLFWHIYDMAIWMNLYFGNDNTYYL